MRTRNEDALFASSRVLVLADGMGGHPAGDVAASIVTHAFAAAAEQEPVPSDAADWLRAAVLAGDETMRAHVEANPADDGLGTTLTAVRVDGATLGLLHAGDSRAYLWREGDLYQLSHDDTLVQSMVDEGMISREEARSHPQRSVILRALMGRGAEFSLATYDLWPGDRLLLCSDGLSDVMADDELAAVLGASEPEFEPPTPPTPVDLDACADELVRAAIAAGTRDNVSCIVAEVVPVDASVVTEPVLAGAAAVMS